MSTARFDVLVGALLEDGLTSAEAEELAALVRGDPVLRTDLRRQLVLWELWSQHHAPERSAASFLAACHTRLRAESQGGRETFVSSLHQRLAAPSHHRPAGRRPGWLRPRLVAWAAPLVAVFLVTAVWLAVPRPAQATSLRGEAVCTACILHLNHEHRPALRVRDGETTRIYLLDVDPARVPTLGDFCSAPVPVDATGEIHGRAGGLVLRVTSLVPRPPDSAPPPSSTGDERMLFPF